MEALAAIQGGMSSMQLSMSSMQQSISAMQQEVHSTRPAVMRRMMHRWLLHPDFFLDVVYFWDIGVIILILCYICLNSWIFYYSVYPGPSKSFRRSNFFLLVLIFITLFYPLPLL
jgi:hypothetical protein